MSENVVAVSVAILVPLATALAGVLSLLLQDWRLRRSRADRRRVAFEDATRQVAFAAEWWTAQQLLPSTPESLQDATTVAQGWLNEASARVDAADEPPPVQRGRLLLLYGFQTRSAKTIRIGFFTVLGVMAFTSLSILSSAVDKDRDLGWLVVYLILFGVLALFLRFWAVSADTADQD